MTAVRCDITRSHKTNNRANRRATERWCCLQVGKEGWADSRMAIRARRLPTAYRVSGCWYASRVRLLLTSQVFLINSQWPVLQRNDYQRPSVWETGFKAKRCIECDAIPRVALVVGRAGKRCQDMWVHFLVSWACRQGRGWSVSHRWGAPHTTARISNITRRQCWTQ